MKRLLTTFVIFAGLLVINTSVHAQDSFAGLALGMLTTDEEESDFEFTFGLRYGTFLNENVSLGGILDRTDMDYGFVDLSLTKILFSANYHFDGLKGPFVAGRIGFVHSRAEVNFLGVTASDSNTYLALGGAVGYMAPVADQVGLGIEGTLTNVFTDVSFLEYGFMGSVNYLF